jgi:tRNA 2-selenouridine synthase
MFENLLALELKKATDKGQPLAGIWIEDESQRIGMVNIPANFFKQMRTKPVYFLHVPPEERLQHIVAGYGKGDKQELVSAIIRIQKRLGGLETKTAINHLIEDNLYDSFKILLNYYDKQYLKGLQSRDSLEELVHEVACETVDPVKNAKHIFAKIRIQADV